MGTGTDLAGHARGGVGAATAGQGWALIVMLVKTMGCGSLLISLRMARYRSVSAANSMFLEKDLELRR